MMLFMGIKMIKHEQESMGFVYKWTNKVNDHWYIGSHRGNENDGYLGSGISFRDAIAKHGIENFAREILYVGPDFRVEEERLLIELDAAHDSMSYNHKNQACGVALSGPDNGMFGQKLSEDERYRCGNAFRGKKRPEHSERMKGENNPRFGQTEHTHGLKSHAKMLKGKTFDEIYGIERADELRKHLSESQKNRIHDLKKRTCPRCGLTGCGPNMTRYHFNKCDLQKIVSKLDADVDKEQRRSDREYRTQVCFSLYQQGISIQEIAQLLGCSEQIVYRQLKSDGVEFIGNHQEIYCVGCHEKVNMTTLMKYHNKCFKLFIVRK